MSINSSRPQLHCKWMDKLLPYFFFAITSFTILIKYFCRLLTYMINTQGDILSPCFTPLLMKRFLSSDVFSLHFHAKTFGLDCLVNSVLYSCLTKCSFFLLKRNYQFTTTKSGNDWINVLWGKKILYNSESMYLLSCSFRHIWSKHHLQRKVV